MSDTNDRSHAGVLESIQTLFTASRGYLMVNVANFGDGVAYFGFLALMVLFMEKNVGFSTNWSTTAVSFYTGAVTIFMALGAGAVADRLGVRRALTLVWMLLIAGRVVFTASPMGGGPYLTGTLAILGLFLMAAGEGVIQPTLYAGVKHYTDERTKTLGYAFIYAVMNLGIVAGELLSPFIREYWARHMEGLDIRTAPAAGISGAFWFFTLVTVVLLLLHITLFTRKVERRDLRISPEEEPAGPQVSFIDKLKALPIMDVRFLYFIFILLPVRTLFAHQFLTMPLFVERAYPPAVAARWEWIYVINPVIIVIFVPLFAALTLKRRVLDLMIVGTAVSAVCSFILCTEPNLTFLITYMIAFSLGEAIWSSRFLEYIADISPARRIGIYMGIATIPWFLAKMTTGFYAGAMLNAFVPAEGPQSPQMLWFIYGLIALVSPIGLLLARRWLLGGVRNEGVGSGTGG